jgi:hypothetical protein
MPIEDLMNDKHDFEMLYFEKDRNVDETIANFFLSNDIVGDKEYITYKIKQVVDNVRQSLYNNTLPLNICGKTVFLKHKIIPEQNNNREYYTYCLHVFI